MVKRDDGVYFAIHIRAEKCKCRPIGDKESKNKPKGDKEKKFV
jgi:hypothetical protein